MKARTVERQLSPSAQRAEPSAPAQPAAGLQPGLVLAQDVRSAEGKIALDKGHVLDAADVRLLDQLPWTSLHLLQMEPGDLHEDEAGRRLAHAAAGPGVTVHALAGGAWPLVSRHRGLLELDEPRLQQVNEVEDVVIYTLSQRQIVLEGELLGRAKIIPFVTREEHIDRAVALATASPGLLRVRPFIPTRVAALVQESLEDSALARFRAAFEEKLAFFGSELLFLQVVPGSAEALAQALTESIAKGAQLVAVAGSKPMDPLDPSLQALERAGARMEKHGVPSHPGTLLWLAELGKVPIIGMPTCGLFSKATVLDLLLPRVFAGERLSRAALAELGSGGLLTRDMAFRFPPYRPTRNRGELDSGP